MGDYAVRRAERLRVLSCLPEWGDVIRLGHLRVGLERLCDLYTARELKGGKPDEWERGRMNELAMDLSIVAERMSELGSVGVRECGVRTAVSTPVSMSAAVSTSILASVCERET